MGDRANIVIREDRPGDLDPFEATFLYAHWHGTELPAILRDALNSSEGRGRWGDGSYLARIVFQRMVEAGSSRETGFGISTRITDNEYPLLVLHKRRVYLLPEAQYTKDGFATLAEYGSVTFEDYITLPKHDWDTVYKYVSNSRRHDRTA